MTDKQVRVLSRTQMLTLLLQQEQEIEKLTADLNDAAKQLAAKSKNADASPELLASVLCAAQEAADKYVLDAKAAEDDKRKELARLEEETRLLRQEANRYYKETIAEATRVIDRMRGAVKGQIDQANQIYSEFQSIITSNNLPAAPPAENPGEPAL